MSNDPRETPKPPPFKDSYDYIVLGAGASGSVVAAELSKTRADVLLVESGGADEAPTIGNPSVWFYNVGGPLDWNLPIAPAPQLNNRQFSMALGHVLGGGSSINAMVWSRGMERDYDNWEAHGASGWGFKDVLPMFKSQEDGQVRLASADWRAAPIIEANYLGTDRDLAAALRAIEAARELGRQAALDGVRQAEVIPGPNATTRQDLVDLARTASASFGHAVGTAKIGSDSDAVVDSDLGSTAFGDCVWRTRPSCRRSCAAPPTPRPS